jgi:hypothetical protein
MSMIKVIDKIQISSNGPITQTGDLIHLRQGDMDGACGPYALMMSLIINEVIVRNDAVSLGKIDGRTRLGKFKNNLLLFGSLCHEGTFAEDLEWLTDCFKNKAVAETHEQLPTKQLAATIKEYIDQETSVILGVKWQGGGGHWVVVVGYETIGDQLTKLLVLDPGDPPSRINSWNAVIDLFDEEGYAVNKSKFSGEHWTEKTSTNMKIDDCVVISTI